MNESGHLPVLRSVARSVVLAGLASAAAWAMDGAYSLASQSMAYLLAVVFSAFRFGRRDSILTAFLGVAALNFFFVPPRYTFSVENSDYGITLIALLAVSLVVSGLATRLRAETLQAQIRERQAKELHALADGLAGTEDVASLAARSLDALRQAFGEGVLLLPDATGVLSATPPGAAIEANAARWVFEQNCPSGPGTGYWPEQSRWYVPLRAEPTALGVVSVETGRRDPDAIARDLEHLEAFARQIALALQRVHLSRMAREAALEAHTESLRNALLASISHDMRTPLAAILGAASTLASQAMPAAEQKPLLHSIEEEARRMSATAANILQLARLSADRVNLRRDWESIGEIAGTVIGRLRRRGYARLVARIDEDLPLVRVDAVLIEQALSNLIDNALQHAPGDEAIEVLVHARDGQISVSVADRGPGLRGIGAARLFAKFQRGSTAPAGGTGLGLAICKAIVELHGGAIRAEEREGGGALFEFTLPIEGDAPDLGGAGSRA